jgi:hypothetical protein
VVVNGNGNGNGMDTGNIIVIAVGGRNGQPKQVMEPP